MKRSALLTVSALLALLACDRPSAPGATKAIESAPDSASKSAEDQAAALAKATASASDETFEATLTVEKAAVDGKPAAAKVVLTPKSGWKCNDEYPHKFKLGTAPAGVSYPTDVVRGGEISKERVVLTVPFTSSGVGKKRIGGIFHFSVCNEAKCHIEKRALATTVNVSAPES